MYYVRTLLTVQTYINLGKFDSAKRGKKENSRPEKGMGGPPGRGKTCDIRNVVGILRFSLRILGRMFALFNKSSYFIKLTCTVNTEATSIKHFSCQVRYNPGV